MWILTQPWGESHRIVVFGNCIHRLPKKEACKQVSPQCGNLPMELLSDVPTGIPPTLRKISVERGTRTRSGAFSRAQSVPKGGCVVADASEGILRERTSGLAAQLMLRLNHHE